MTATSVNPYLTALQALNDGVLLDRQDRGRLSDRFDLSVAGARWTDFARDVRFENTGDEGGSVLTFNSKKPMDDLGDAEVRLRIDDRPYFVGNLKRPMPSSGFAQSATALGPFAAMASQFFGEQTSYTNNYLDTALYSIAGKAYTVSGIVEVIGGDNLTIEEADYTEETSLMEGAKAICDPANFVMVDTDIGGRRFMRRPRASANGAAVRAYTPDDYEDGAFTIEQKYDGAYSRVVVFRRNDVGGYAVREEFPVEQVGQFKAPRLRIYYIPDYPGNATQGKQEAFDTARSLIEGEVTFSLTVPLDSAVRRYQTITCARDVERNLPSPGLYRETYGLVIESGLEADCSGETMTLSGSGLLRRRVRIEGPKRAPEILSAGSPYLVGG